MARNDSNWSKPFNFLEHWQVWHIGRDNILPSTGRENNTAQPETDQWFSSPSHFFIVFHTLTFDVFGSLAGMAHAFPSNMGMYRTGPVMHPSDLWAR